MSSTINSALPMADDTGVAIQYTYQRCSVDGCGRRHPGGEDTCWVAHPQLNPRGGGNQRGVRGRGRGRGRGTRGSRGSRGDTPNRSAVPAAEDQDASARVRGSGRGPGFHYSDGRVLRTFRRSNQPSTAPMPASTQPTSSFHALPQEVQDRIYEKMYESYDITATLRKNAHNHRRYHLNHNDARLVLWGLPKRSMELACKKNLADAEQIRKDGFEGDLGIVYTEEDGSPMTALRDEELTWLRNKVKTIYYCGFNGKSLRYMYPSADWWNEMPGDFPNVQEITIDYTVLRYAYEDPMTEERKTQDFQEVRTPEYCAAFERGEKDAGFAYPAQYLKLYDLAKFMEEHELKFREASGMTEKAEESNNEHGPLHINGVDGTQDSDTTSTPERSADSTSTDDSNPLIINGEVVPDRGCKTYLITTVDFKQRHYTIYSQVVKFRITSKGWACIDRTG